ncbi:MAG: hypothetical protein V5A88_06725 [Candidatus Thermoplasmatota archaeon]
MKKKIFVVTVTLSLLLSGLLVAVGIGIGVIIGILVILSILLAVITHMMKGGEEIKPETEEDKLGHEHHREVRATALGCYGDEAEEEKFGYEESPPQQSR